MPSKPQILMPRFDIEQAMIKLSRNRQLFHGEADFQHALAWEIHNLMPEVEIRLEVDMSPTDDERLYLDVWIPSEGIALELKYATRNLVIEHHGERFRLRDQSAQDVKRYDVLKDVMRLERVVAEVDRCSEAHMIFVTNDPGYWNPSRRPDTVDVAFRLHEGREVFGEMSWSPRASAGTRAGREEPIGLKGSYHLQWKDFSNLGTDGYGEFRYLAIPVTGTTAK